MKKSAIICRCNMVDAETILKAIQSGAKTPNEVFDKTGAGVGACGGSCRKTWVPWLLSFLKDGTLPEVQRQKRND